MYINNSIYTKKSGQEPPRPPIVFNQPTARTGGK